ncbi:tRNA (adenosine(37)-N6)-threonylcarbamoyltransferase complex ATPase subunit type 1 TsaE [Tessaracoccus caeni]|uniref:tRNA (adenosine(37)-N6)-threonylcarbamoyltransferase complex ATPase subunit type 1 TsaE n=1 Tax=Tessaracoccus caeni TaxID=3031239 RepID=UPI0029E828E6|nr:tRNA (adenosine(37)-N6)-threonylcarbamoyltransferase complex ATPase subunit type 1 TsaE [Tessaracoccus caeni]
MSESTELTLRLAVPEDSQALLGVIREAFSARAPVDPPAAALAEDEDTIRAALAEGFGVLAEIDGRPVAGLLVRLNGDLATLRRVSVLPSASGAGVARTMVEAAALAAVDAGATRVELLARREFPDLVAWWQKLGFQILRPAELGFVLGRPLPVALDIPTAEAMQDLGRRLATMLRAGDVIVANGDLGAGKTTLTQGIGEGLGIEGPVISPTFVISRVHPNAGDGPALVHVDAYRLGSPSELNDIDLDATLADAVTLVEWGRGVAEWLSADRLEIDIVRSDDPSDDTRTVYLTGLGARWADALETLREQP